MGKRAKQYKKLMRAFQLLGFREPYQLLMTSDIILETLKLDLIHLFEKTLSTKNLKPMITQCCIVSSGWPVPLGALKSELTMPRIASSVCEERGTQQGPRRCRRHRQGKDV